MEKIKPTINTWLESEKGRQIFTIVIIVLVGLGSFQIGRLSKGQSEAGIKIEYTGEYADAQAANVLSAVNPPASSLNPPTSSQNTSKNPPTLTFFASKRGHKYYPSNCSAGKTIKQENRVYFASRAEAEAAGYELSSSCR